MNDEAKVIDLLLDGDTDAALELVKTLSLGELITFDGEIAGLRYYLEDEIVKKRREQEYRKLA